MGVTEEARPVTPLRVRASGRRQQTADESKGSEITVGAKVTDASQNNFMQFEYGCKTTSGFQKPRESYHRKTKVKTAAALS